MPISQLSAEDAAACKAQRLRLEPIAIANGLVYSDSDDDWQVLRALEVIAREQDKLGVVTSGKSGSSATRGQQIPGPGADLLDARAQVKTLGQLQQQQARQRPQTEPEDMGDAVVDLLRAQRGLPPLRANGGQ